VSTRKLITRAEIARMAADAIAYRSHDHCEARQISTGAEGPTMRTQLPADLTSAGQARSAVRRALTAWGMDHLADDAELLASELVANAAEHGERPGVTCAITGTAPQSVRRREPGPDAERGRGLAIVAALARASGVRAIQAGKTTWFTLALTDHAHRVARQIEHQAEAGA
jgi:hypothetical protein